MTKQTENGSSAEKRFPVSFGFIFSLLVIFLVVKCLFPGEFSSSHVYQDNEAGAISVLREISVMQENYINLYDRYGTLKGLQIEWTECFDKNLAQATSPEHAKRGYYYILKNDQFSWSMVALPAEPGKTGTRSFFTDETGVIRFVQYESKDDLPADKNSSPLGE